MELTVEPLGRRIVVDPGRHLLDVLCEHAVPISYSCRSGRCGTCRCRLIKGKLATAGMSAAEAMDGEAFTSVLACQAVLTEDCTVLLDDAGDVVVHPARICKGIVSEIEFPAADVLRLRLVLNKPLAYSPGQYAQLQLENGLARPYSMAGLAGDAALEFHVRKVPAGRVTDFLFSHLKIGDSVRVSGPMGTSYLRRQHEGPMLCVGAGTGLAPVLSVVRGAIAAGMLNPIHLYFGVRSRQDRYDGECLEALARHHPQIRVHTVVATGTVPNDARPGALADAIREDVASMVDWRAYLGGSPAVVEVLQHLVRELGVSPDHVYADSFYSSGA